MVDVDVFVEIGSSNCAGFLAKLDDVPLGDMTRWLGAGGAHPPIPSTSAQRPYEARIPNARVFTPRRPYSLNINRAIVGIAGGDGTVDVATVAPTPANNSWIYIRLNQTGQGNLRKVSGFSAGTGAGGSDRLTVSENFAPVLSANTSGQWGTIHFLQDSGTLTAVDLLQTKITQAGGDPNFGAGVIGRFVLFFYNNVVRKIVSKNDDDFTVDGPIGLTTWVTSTLYAAGSSVVRSGVVYLCGFTHTSAAGSEPSTPAAWSAVTNYIPGDFVTRLGVTYQSLTNNLNQPPETNADDWATLWTPQPGHSTGFCILTGPNACETLPDLLNTAKNTLQDMTFYLDQNAPVFLTGLDYPNFDTTPFQSPKVVYGDGVNSPTCNLSNELQFHLRSRLQNLVMIKMGVSASMISPFLNAAVFSPVPNPYPFGSYIGPFHDIQSLDFSPASVNALFTYTKNSITCTNALIVAEGNKPRYRGILIHLFDNDPVDEQRVLRLAANAAQLRDAIRAHIGDPTVPCIFSGPSHYGGSDTTRDFIYDNLKHIAASDPAGTTGVTDNRNLNDIPSMFAFDNLHLSALGQIELAQNNFDTWDPIFVRHYEDVNAANSMAVEISNLALSLLGQSAKVFSLDTTLDQSAEARLCAQFYPPAFQAVREMHAWAFSTYTKVLESVDKDEHRTDWAFAYLPPADMDTPIKVVMPGMAVTSGEVPPWWRDPSADGTLAAAEPNYALEVDSMGRRVIYTNVQDALLKYVAKVNSKTIVPRSFKTAVARRLAAFLAGPIVKGAAGAALTREFEGLARLDLGDAAAHDANRQQQDPPPDRMPWSR